MTVRANPADVLGADIDELATNIVTVFRSASTADRRSGESWYQDARGIAESLDPS